MRQNFETLPCSLRSLRQVSFIFYFNLPQFASIYFDLASLIVLSRAFCKPRQGRPVYKKPIAKQPKPRYGAACHSSPTLAALLCDLCDLLRLNLLSFPNCQRAFLSRFRRSHNKLGNASHFSGGASYESPNRAGRLGNDVLKATTDAANFTDFLPNPPKWRRTCTWALITWLP